MAVADVDELSRLLALLLLASVEGLAAFVLEFMDVVDSEAVELLCVNCVV